MAGWVLVVSLLFSPGMLPAERPSHLYLNRIPLCFGCSMISMKGLAVWTEGQVEAREEEEEEEEEEECDLNAKTQYPGCETPPVYAALLEMFTHEK